MKQTIDLMKPRYKVIADYPGNNFERDTVLIQDLDTVGEVWVDASSVGEKNTDRDFILPDYIDKYPHLFKPLQWWEERKPEEISWIKYLKWNQASGKNFPFEMMSLNHERRVAIWNVQGYGPPLIECEPITEAEYQNYLKSKS